MRLKIEINMDNAAFEIYPEREINRILKKISLEIMAEETYGNCMDINGNKVGYYEMRYKVSSKQKKTRYIHLK